ncbi:MAG: hypothetical protein J6S58_03050 [Lentisphaeria bacterium]|nr:hypothetical protein [Lentisphaeria bacterium]
MNKYFLTALSAALLSSGAVSAQDLTLNPPKGSIPALGGNPTGAYGASRVETKLNVQIKEGTKAVHFIRDNNDPWVVTKAYVIKNADPFILRGVLKSIVTGSLKESPVAIESIKYVDGTGVLLVSAEEYRFKNAGKGMSMDALVAALDKKNLPNSSGTIDMAYFPKYCSAAELLEMMQKSGIGFTGSIAGVNAVTHNKHGLHLNPVSFAGVDKKMNAIIMTAPGFDMQEALNFLKEVDTPADEIHVTYKLVEIYAENDQKIGLDFQAWKNNDGIDLFSVSGKYTRNMFRSTLVPNAGYRNVDFFNFNPKWNTKYIDFLTTNGKAKVVSTGTLLVSDGATVKLTLNDGLFSVISEKISVEDDNGKRSKQIGDNMPSPDAGKRYAENLARAVTDMLKQEMAQGYTQSAQVDARGTTFTLKVSGDVHPSASNLDFTLKSTSLIGWDSKGDARLATSKTKTRVQLFNNKRDFVIGGVTKSSVVRSVSGIPLLKDLPVLGWLFSTETDMVKKSQYVLVASAEVVDVDSTLKKVTNDAVVKIGKSVEKAVKSPVINPLGFQQLLLDTDK